MRQDPDRGVLAAVARLEKAFDTRMTHLEQTLGARLTTLEGKFDTLPQQFVTLREFTQEQNTAREERSSVREQLATLNEWRAGMLQTQMIGMQQQIGTVAKEAAKDDAATSKEAHEHVLALSQGQLNAALLILGILLSAVLAHAFWH